MKQEVESAVEFVTNLLGKRIPEVDIVNRFHDSLENVLLGHYQDHWFPEKPFKGSAYRSMRIVNRKMDPLITKAGAKVGLTESDLLNYLPSELTLWIDPEEVSYRIGEDGSIGVLFCIEATSQKQIQSSDSESDSSSGSLSSSPSQSQEYLSFQQQVCQDRSRFDFPQSSLAQVAATGPYHHHSQVADPMAHHWGDYFATFVAS